MRRGLVVGEGFHRGKGHPHAEAIALRRAGKRAVGADVYVTLEPCCHWGATPGCAQALAAAGVRRVFFAVEDPDPHARGRGASALEAAGVEVFAGLLADQARRLYAAYFKHRLTGLPLVAAKMAASLDGKVATRTGESRWLSCPESRELVHRWRDEYDAVMVGVGTVLTDNPRLTCRRADRVGRDPLRVIADSRARTPPEARVLAPKAGARCIIAVTPAAPADRIRALEQAGADVWLIDAGPDGRLDLSLLIRRLGDAGVLSVMLEGGPTLLAAALSAGIVDKLLVFYTPKVIGGVQAPGMVGGEGVQALAEAGGWRIEAVHRVGADVLVEAHKCSPESSAARANWSPSGP